MDASHIHLDALAAAVADGLDVDWDTAEEGTSDIEERGAIRQLRQLAEIRGAAQTSAKFWGPLELRGEIGRGTFGTVFRAWDNRLQREVALKLLKSTPAESGTALTTIAEGQLLARIRHPNVVCVYGADVHDGVVGIWMELVVGQTLKAAVEQQGPYGAHEAAVIGRDICDALAAVHVQGVLHRDIKAQNVIREAGGRIVLMDFGAGDVAAGARPLAGTPVYLAPEVLQGTPFSPQTDIYSLGILLYYLVSGTFPVNGKSLDEIRTAHARKERRLLRDIRPDLRETFVLAVNRAIAPDPADRPASAGALEQLLRTSLGAPGPVLQSRTNGVQRWLLPAVAAVAVAVLGGAVWWTSRDAPVNSVAVLPFRNLSPAGAADDYLTEGLTDDLATHLLLVRDLRVVSGASTRRFSSGAEPGRIANELSVNAVLEGSVRRDGNSVRIASRLSDARTGALIWSESFDRDIKDIFTMQPEVARKIAVALKGELSMPDAELLKGAGTRDFETTNLYMKGRYAWRLRTEDGLNRSINLFTEATTRDPSFALAYAGLADSYTALGTYGFLPRAEAFRRAATAATRAVELDASLAEANAALGYALKNRFEWAAADEYFRKAIALKPTWATAHHWYSILLTQLGDYPKAITEAKAAISLDPLAVGPNMQLAAVLLMAHRYDDSVAQYEAAIRIDPGIAAAYRSIGQVRTYQENYSEAAKALERAVRATPAGAEDQEIKAALGYLHARSGRTDQALALAQELSRRYEAAGEAVAGSVAAIYAGLGQHDKAFQWLTRAVEARDPEAGYLKVDPRWDGLRQDARFVRLLGKLGLDK